MRKRALKDSVIVITGASSGIGRGSALAFAQRGAIVVLTGRTAHTLEKVAEECRLLGGQALAVPAEVTNEMAIRDLARQAIEQYGRIDVWVNNAGVTAFGRVEEMPCEAYRRVMDINFFGYLHGARAVIPCFREQGSGILINVSSQNGKVGSPYVSAYAASKFAINGLSESLRMELRDAPDIHVCTVLGGSIDTPLFQHAANYTGRAIKPLDPVYPAAVAIRQILSLAEHPRREVYAGGAARAMAIMRLVAPPLAERMIARQVDVNHFQDRPAAAGPGNLFEPMAEWNDIGGGWRGPDPARPVRPGSFGLAALALGVGMIAGRRLRTALA